MSQFKSVPQILGSLGIHIFKLLFSLSTNVKKLLRMQHVTKGHKPFEVSEICFCCRISTGSNFEPLLFPVIVSEKLKACPWK